MSRLKIFIILGFITAGCSSYAWSDTINSTSVDLNNRMVVVSVSLHESNIDESLTEIFFEDGIFNIGLHSIENTSMPNGYEALVHLGIPDCSEYTGISAVLYSPLDEPGETYSPMLVNSSMPLGNCNVGVNTCGDTYQECLRCDQDCMLIPDITLSLICGLSCKEDSVCLQELDACNMLWEQSLVDEPVSITVQAVIPEDFGNTEDSEMIVSCRPKTLNKKSKGKWITCQVCLEEGNPLSINAGSMELNLEGSGSLAVSKSKMDDERLVLKFSREGIIELVGREEGSMEIRLTDGVFGGVDTINVINTQKRNMAKRIKQKKGIETPKFAKKN